MENKSNTLTQASKDGHIKTVCENASHTHIDIRSHTHSYTQTRTLIHTITLASRMGGGEGVKP